MLLEIPVEDLYWSIALFDLQKYVPSLFCTKKSSAIWFFDRIVICMAEYYLNVRLIFNSFCRVRRVIFCDVGIKLLTVFDLMFVFIGWKKISSKSSASVQKSSQKVLHQNKNKISTFLFPVLESIFLSKSHLPPTIPVREVFKTHYNIL